jgi:hypothetical protein
VRSYVLLGAGAASIVVGAVFGILALSAKSSFDSNPSYDQADTVRTQSMVSDVTLGLGIVLAGAGTAFLLSESGSSGTAHAAPPSPHTGQVRVTPVVGTSRGGAALTVSF